MHEGEQLAALAATLERELAWLSVLIDHRFRVEFAPVDAVSNDAVSIPSPPELASWSGPFAEAVRTMALDEQARQLLILALAPHLRPAVLDAFRLRNMQLEGRYAELGGRSARTHVGFLPTVETACFLLAGNSLLARLKVYADNGPVHRLVSAGILDTSAPDNGEPWGAAHLNVTDTFLRKLFGGS